MTRLNTVARWLLEGLFAALTVTYGLCFAHNMGWM